MPTAKLEEQKEIGMMDWLELDSPLVNLAFLVAQGHGDSSDIVQLEPWVVLMEVRGHPANPHAAGLLAREDPY